MRCCRPSRLTPRWSPPTATPRRRRLARVDAAARRAASLSVQDSIDVPETPFDNDVIGTFGLPEAARAKGARFLFMSTCMVYDRATTASGIDEDHPTKPASP